MKIKIDAEDYLKDRIKVIINDNTVQSPESSELENISTEIVKYFLSIKDDLIDEPNTITKNSLYTIDPTYGQSIITGSITRNN